MPTATINNPHCLCLFFFEVDSCHTHTHTKISKLAYLELIKARVIQFLFRLNPAE